MSKLDPTQLSSNWKRLQEKVRGEKKSQSSTGTKRKRNFEKSDEVSAVKSRDLKKRRENPKQPLRRKSFSKMGAVVSSQSGNERDTIIDAAHNNKVEKAPAKTSALGAASESDTQPLGEVPNAGLATNRKIGKYVALDCEMVGTGPPPHLDHVLARASLVNFHGEQIYDSYVIPPPGIAVLDYRTHVSGITPASLRPGYARSFQEVQKDVEALLEGRVLVGHALKNDLQVLILNHPKRDLRDTSRHPRYRIKSRGKPPALRDLARDELGLVIHRGEHSSVEDARVTMALYRKEKAGFEEENRKYYGQARMTKERAAMVKQDGRGQSRSRDLTVEDQDSEGGEEDDEDDADVLDDEDQENIGVQPIVRGAGQAKPTKPKKRKKKSRTKRR